MRTLIRQVHLDDIAALSELARQTYFDAFGHSFSTTDLAFHLEHRLSDSYFHQAIEKDVILVAEVEAQLVGFVQFGAVEMPKTAASPRDQELRRLYVHADFRNRGLGGQLMQTALEHPRLKAAENVYLDVWEQNLGAQRFYERFGFQVVGRQSLVVASGAATDWDLVMVRPSRP